MTTPAKATKELAEMYNAGINAGAEIACIVLGLTRAQIDDLFLRNVKFTTLRNQRRDELVARAKGKAK